ncbi:peptidoglycan D,D-transpeptidase FtsI family protein [Mesobacillus foraminis]|uniref:peptidoglycan D,D-transpeptidase FtsI family protein n=1 Tax=Mesobacillus foraminis TaxID=279826 RepID=UPI000EF46000|nr:penicillin-binding protein 2 [Mesobacillus foraminis]
MLENTIYITGELASFLSEFTGKEVPEMREKRRILYSRFKILFMIVFLLFSILILRLGKIQIVKGEEYREESEKTNQTVYSWNTPRGKIYDRNGTVLVENEPIYTLTYADPAGSTQQEKLELAKKLAGMISVDTKNMTERDKKDYWILTRKDKAYAKLSSTEQANLDDNEEYDLILERITDKELKEITEEEMEVLAIKKEMDTDSSSAKRLKSGLTTEERAVLNENLGKLPGVEVKVDSQRDYVYGDTLRQLFGKVGRIPEEEADTYKENGYDLNDLVGTSFLEQYYEKWLQGEKEKTIYIKDGTGEISEVKVDPGESGKDLILTIDLNLQQEAEKIIVEELKKDNGAKSAYVVVTNPKTGEILAIAGKKETEKDIQDEAYGALYNSYAMGSTVKGATVLTGYETGVISPGDTFVDAPIKLSGTPLKKSYVNMGRINELTALERSSNVYMFHIAMKIGDYDYGARSGFEDPEESYKTFRKYFAQFGLGVETGIDLPTEATGYYGGVQKLGNLMDFAIGQFDTYTPLQLVQYVSTIANDGNRVQPHLMKEIREPNHESGQSGEVLEQFKTNVLNTVDMDLSYIKRVQEGFRLVMNGSQGTAASHFKGATYHPAGKTGTAQVLDEDGGYNYNLTLVGYAPYEDPEVAISVVVPDVENDSSGINKAIGKRIFDAYFDKD